MQSATVTATVGAAGGALALADVATVTLPAGYLASNTQLMLASVVSPSLDADAENGADLYPIASFSSSHVLLSGIPAAATGDIPVVINVSADLKRSITASVAPAALIWQFDSSPSGDHPESLLAHQLVAGTYDPQAGTLAFIAPSQFFETVDPQTHASVADKRLSLSVVLLDSSADQVTAVAKTTEHPVAAPSLSCGGGEWVSPLLVGASIIGPFAESYGHSSTHQGIDLATLDFNQLPTTGQAVYAVDSGYVKQVKRQDCTGSSVSQCSTTPGSYALVQVTSLGEEVAYRHLQYGGIQVPGLSSEATINTLWRDNGSKKYRLQKGQLIAKSGDTGAAGNPHLHLEFAPRQSVDASTNRRNPLCRLAVLSPYLNGPINYRLGFDDVHAYFPQDLVDSQSGLIRVRRKKGVTRDKDEYLSAFAHPTGTTVFPLDSAAEVATFVATSANTAVVTIYSFLLPNVQYQTFTGGTVDYGVVGLTLRGVGTADVVVAPMIRIGVSDTAAVALGAPMHESLTVRNP